jgi:hypothetical protein
MIVAAFMIGAPALANESKFSFTMAHRYVNGEHNDIKHDMNKGTLTVSGELWVTSCEIIDKETGKTTVPELVTLRVVQETSIGDNEVCGFSVVPSATIGKKVPFEVTCGAILRKSEVYLVSFQESDNDGCAIEASGRLTTK